MKPLFPILFFFVALVIINIHQTWELSNQKKSEIKKTSLQQEKRKLPTPKSSTTENSSFTEKLQTFYAALPKVSEFRVSHTSEDVHGTPQAVLASASIFTELDTTYNQPENFENTAKFYDLCIHNEDFFSSIRAVCYFKLSQLNPQLSHPYDLANFPQSIRELGEIKY